MVEFEAQIIVNGVLDSFAQMKPFKGAFMDIGDEGWSVNKLSGMEGALIGETQIHNCYVLEVSCDSLKNTPDQERLVQAVYTGLKERVSDALAIMRGERWCDGPSSFKMTLIMPLENADKNDAVRSS